MQDPACLQTCIKCGSRYFKIYKLVDTFVQSCKINLSWSWPVTRSQASTNWIFISKMYAGIKCPWQYCLYLCALKLWAIWILSIKTKQKCTWYMLHWHELAPRVGFAPRILIHQTSPLFTKLGLFSPKSPKFMPTHQHKILLFPMWYPNHQEEYQYLLAN